VEQEQDMQRTCAIKSDGTLDHPVDEFANDVKFFLIPEGQRGVEVTYTTDHSSLLRWQKSFILTIPYVPNS